MKPLPTTLLPRGMGYEIWMQLSKRIFKSAPAKTSLGAELLSDAKFGIETSPAALKGRLPAKGILV